MLLTEDQLQIAVAKLLDSLRWLWWHTPNGGLRNLRVARKLQHAGVKPGVADVIIAEQWRVDDAVLPGHIWCNARYGHMVAIELKVGRNTPTRNQQVWLTDVLSRGWLCCVARNLDQVADVLTKVLPVNGRRFQGLQ